MISKGQTLGNPAAGERAIAGRFGLLVWAGTLLVLGYVLRTLPAEPTDKP